MLEKLISIFRGAKFASVGHMFSLLAPLLEELEENYTEDKNAKNAAIDTLIQILEQHKDKMA